MSPEVLPADADALAVDCAPPDALPADAPPPEAPQPATVISAATAAPARTIRLLLRLFMKAPLLGSYPHPKQSIDQICTALPWLARYPDEHGTNM